MKITDLIQMDSIFLDSNASSQSSMFKEISDRISEKVEVSSNLILRRINEQEKLGSTAIGEGIAIHIPKLSANIFAFFLNYIILYDDNNSESEPGFCDCCSIGISIRTFIGSLPLFHLLSKKGKNKSFH